MKLSLKASAFLVGTTLVSLVFILAHDALTQSRYFKARTITIDGNQRVSQERVLELGQIDVGDNILAMNLKLLRQRLLNNPWIADVELERELPDAVHIVVREHVPAAIVNFDQDYYVSSTGQIIGAVSDSDQIHVPRLTGLTIADFAPESRQRSPETIAFLKLVELSCLDGSILPLHEIERIDIDPQIGVTLSAFENRIAIKLGKTDYTGKFNRIRDMIAYLREGKHLRHVACIDLNDLDRVVVGAVEKKSLLGVCYRKET
jgi:cell division protein FtsQ